METGEEKPDRFKVLCGVLIAVVTLVGAIVAWRVAEASGAAGSADSKGLAAALQSANTGIQISTYLSMNLGFFAEYLQHMETAGLLERQASNVSDAARAAALREQALQERNLAASARGFFDQDYARVDPATGKEFFDGNRYWTVQWAEAAVQQNIDYQAPFGEADRKRDKARGLTGVTVAFSMALVLLTAATAIKKRIRIVFAGVASVIFLTALAAAVVLELMF